MKKILLILMMLLMVAGCGPTGSLKYKRSKTMIFKAKQLDAEGLKALKYGDKICFLVKIWDDIYLWVLADGYASVDKNKVYNYYITLKKGDNVDLKKDLGFLKVLNAPNHGPSADGVFAWHYDEGVNALPFLGVVNGKREEFRNVEFEKYNMTIKVKDFDIEKLEYVDKWDGKKQNLSFFKKIEMEITVSELR
ncbi:MAG: hypothetical protein A2452_02620 [Candidatus Firestonebacteria bacterium RIFOXYC2_FULL_39_67]|nr:MAG: hypothetical protein A2536_06955 [Candidatus Firestonebacteria bacterium RIFOXYD2_FULL_39_29]OGF54012.1 MAG: hypothetical protein A2452_02620 [Candidatus Firestonebacteria bacterium RIFOXYC2_FULL_39_67]